MSKFMDVVRIIKFIFTKRKVLNRVKKEILDVKEEIDKAKADDNISKEVNDIIIKELLD